MPRYLLDVRVDDYWRYVIDASDEEEAQKRAYRDFREALDTLENPTIDVTLVPSDTPLGDT